MLLKKSIKKSTNKKKIHSKITKNALKVKYFLQKTLDNSDLWLKALLSIIERGFQLKKTANLIFCTFFD